jgi:hypothetical protein
VCVSGRADRVAGAALYPAKKTITNWVNRSAFAAPTANGTVAPGYAYGNSSYNLLWGPSYQNWDMNLEKTTMWREKINLQLRMDAFNVFNHPNFANPAANWSNPSTFGVISSPNGESRKVEFGAKLSF